LLVIHGQKKQQASIPYQPLLPSLAGQQQIKLPPALDVARQLCTWVQAKHSTVAEHLPAMSICLLRHALTSTRFAPIYQRADPEPLSLTP
tara:strand:- start:352 stop:621 length:270 start_codon:yes stop_codon:yes gene_type:complete